MAINGQLVNPQAYTKTTAITLSDVTTYTAFDAFMVGATGTLTFADAIGTSATITATAGVVYQIAATKFLSTGTTATGVVGLRW